MITHKNVTLVNGHTVSVPTVEGIAGVFEENNLTVTVAQYEGFFYAVTDCCGASATGSADGVVCRGCYNEVAELFGATFTQSKLTLLA